MKSTQTGVTLMELLVVTVIVAILAAIAIPGYRQYMVRTNRTEAKVALTAAAANMEKCFTRFTAYDNATCESVVAYTAGQTTEGGNYLVQFAAAPTATAFTVRAVPQGGQTEDTRCGTLTLDQANARTVSGSGTLEDCWRR